MLKPVAVTLSIEFLPVARKFFFSQPNVLSQVFRVTYVCSFKDVFFCLLQLRFCYIQHNES